MTRIGAPNGVCRKSAFDRWFRYPAGFSRKTLDYCFEAVASEDGPIIDPFAGVATTGTRAVEEGYSFRGIEAHPLIAEIAMLKFAPLDESAAAGLETVAREIVASLDSSDIKLTDETSLVRRSFEPETLRELIALRELIGTAQGHLAPYLRCALVGTLRDVASVNVGWPYQRPAVARKPTYRSAAKRFHERVGWLVEDLATVPTARDASITAGDSRASESWKQALGAAKARICLSSPPYLNNFDYADATRLELYFLGSVRTWAELCRDVRANMIAATTQQSTKTRAEAGWATLKRLPRTSKAAQKLCKVLGEQRRERSRGKEYDQMLPAYLADISDVLRQCYEYLNSGALLAWVVGDSAPYGVYIDTPALIAGMAFETGFSPIENVTLRSRGKRWAHNGNRHQVALSERMILLRRDT